MPHVQGKTFWPFPQAAPTWALSVLEVGPYSQCRAGRQKKVAIIKIDLENGSQIQNNQGIDTGRNLWRSGENLVEIRRMIPTANAYHMGREGTEQEGMAGVAQRRELR